MDNILERINKVFMLVFEKEDLEITLKTCADDIEEWDSFKHLTLLAVLEKEFNIKFEIDEIVSMENVGDMVHIIESRKELYE